jgi:hypothetical protein
MVKVKWQAMIMLLMTQADIGFDQSVKLST